MNRLDVFYTLIFNIVFDIFIIVVIIESLKEPVQLTNLHKNNIKKF